MDLKCSRTSSGRHRAGRSPASRARAPNHLVASVGITLLLFYNATLVHGDEKQNRDYYNPGTSADERADWKNAHKFHLQPAFDAMKRGNWSSARDNLEFILRVFPNSPQALNALSELCVLKWKSPL